MRKVSQSGFTLIELIAVIAILAILAVTALPKLLSLTGEAAAASASGIGGAISSGTAINFAKRQVTAAGWTSVTACTNANLASIMTGNVMPVGVSVSGAAAIANGAAGTCTVHYSAASASATVTAIIFGAS